MLSNEGVWILSRVVLALPVLLLVAAMRTVIGRSKQRNRVMMAGTLVGLTLGVVASSVASFLFFIDQSALFTVAGVFVGWAFALPIALRIPRAESHP